MANVPAYSSSGEFTPQLDARADFEKYGAGCRHCENFIPTIYSCAERRSGTLFIVSTEDSYSILSHIVSFENVGVCRHNEVVMAIPNTALVLVILCYENDIVCFENNVVTISDPTIQLSRIICFENNVMFYENEITYFT